MYQAKLYFMTRETFCIWYFDTRLWGQVTHIWVSKLDHHWLRWLVACLVNQYWHITIEKKNRWNLNRKPNIFIQENAFENVVCKWASCQIRKIAGEHASGMLGTFSPSPQVSDPDMHQGTCVTHVPWCIPGSLTSGFLWHRRRGKTFPAFPAHAQPAILHIW